MPFDCAGLFSHHFWFILSSVTQYKMLKQCPELIYNVPTLVTWRKQEVLDRLVYQILRQTSSASLSFFQLPTLIYPELMLRPCSISSDRCRIISAFLAYSQLGIGYLAGVLAGQTNSTLLMPPLSERGETKVVQPFIGTDRVHIQARKENKNTSFLKKGAWF